MQCTLQLAPKKHVFRGFFGWERDSGPFYSVYGAKNEKNTCFENICLLWYTYRFAQLSRTLNVPETGFKKSESHAPKNPMWFIVNVRRNFRILTVITTHSLPTPVPN